MGGVKADVSQPPPDARALQRGRMDLLRARLELLSGKDKVLMTLYVENGSSFRQIARLRGVSETSIARRIHQLTRRLTDGEFVRCVRSRDKLSRRQMAIARDAFLTGLSLRRIAGKRGMSIYGVRRELRDIRRRIREATPASNPY
jgi:DNA-directed RNA polymerase specialized sigma24 family protein